MNNLRCFKHPQYNANQSPDLSCKTCCSLFVSKIRAEQVSSSNSFEVKGSFTSLNQNLGNLKNQDGVKLRFDGSWI